MALNWERLLCSERAYKKRNSGKYDEGLKAAEGSVSEGEGENAGAVNAGVLPAKADAAFASAQGACGLSCKAADSGDSFGFERAYKTDLRNEFEKDYHRIIGSASFRRLQDKTQVFPLDKSDFVRTRLTHTLEVSSFANSLGQSISRSIIENIGDRSFKEEYKSYVSNILLCAGLLHDIGNPPFGHFGETSIRNWFERKLPEISFYGIPLTKLLNAQMQADFLRFEGNAQALRLVTKLHFLVGERGMNLTKALLGTIIKYPIASNEISDGKDGRRKTYKKAGYFYADKDTFYDIEKSLGLNGSRHPLTFILEAADDIAYRTADIEDAVKKGCISYFELLTELKSRDKGDNKGFTRQVERLSEFYDKALKAGISRPDINAVQNWAVNTQGSLISAAVCGFSRHYEEIMAGTYREDLFKGTYMEPLALALGDIAYKYVFTSKPIYKLEISAEVILDNLLEKFVNAVLYYDTDENTENLVKSFVSSSWVTEGGGENKKAICGDALKKDDKNVYKMTDVDKKLVSLISENYMNVYKRCSKGKDEAEKLYLRLMLVTDYICGMTDSFAKSLYQELNAIV